MRVGDWYETEAGEFRVEGGDLLDRHAEDYVNGAIDVDRFLTRVERSVQKYGVILLTLRKK